MLKRQLDIVKWGSLVLLTLGVSLVQVSMVEPEDENKTEQEDVGYSNQTIGFFAIIIACILSGLTGVYLEKVLKSTPTSIWVRNLQMSFFSFIVGMFSLLWSDLDTIVTNGFFYGYTPLVWVVVLFQAGSGFCVAMVVKYADNILKGFANSLCIVLTTLVSTLWLGFHPSQLWLCGCILVILSTVIYAFPPRNIKPLLPHTHKI